jgi:hypothetical protein
MCSVPDLKDPYLRIRYINYISGFVNQLTDPDPGGQIIKDPTGSVS